MKKITYIIFIIILALSSTTVAQVELVQPSNPVYDYLKRMHTKSILTNYNSANLPYSRISVYNFLTIIASEKDKLSGTDKGLLNDYMVEFSYENNKDLEKSFSFIGGYKFKKIFENNAQKYLYLYSDENVSLFIDGIANYRYRSFSGDSLGSHSLHLADLGLRFRGTMYNKVGYYLHMYSGQQISGEKADRILAAELDPYLKSTPKFINEKYYNSFEGYLRYQTEGEWLALTVGREALRMGTGYIDKLFISGNTVPFDFARLDLEYKSVKYTFIYGNIRGDSLGVRELETKNIISHRLDVRFAQWLKVGFYEAVIAAEFPFNFTYLNPISFLTSADFAVQPGNETNSTLGFDFELNLIPNLGFQGTLFIDDIDFRDLGGSTKKSNDNKFGYQAGLMWADAFTLPNLELALEYTRLDPFVYTHRTNKSNYTHYNFSLGHALPPNSDEIAAKLIYYFSKRIRLDLLYRFQRSGQGLEFDNDGNLVKNYGGNLLRGDGDFLQKNEFLAGNRTNRNIINVDVTIEPVNQYYVKLKYIHSIQDILNGSRKLNDDVFYLTVGVDF